MGRPKGNRENLVLLNIRTVPEIRTGLQELSVLFGKKLGTRLSLSQTLEILITNALKEQREGNDDLNFQISEVSVR